jgi:hypothetical protein
MTKARISAREFVADLRRGADDTELMKKYRLSDVGLGRVFDKLIEADLLSLDELWKRSLLSDSQITRAFVEAQEAIDELD